MRIWACNHCDVHFDAWEAYASVEEHIKKRFVIHVILISLKTQDLSISHDISTVEDTGDDADIVMRPGMIDLPGSRVVKIPQMDGSTSPQRIFRS